MGNKRPSGGDVALGFVKKCIKYGLGRKNDYPAMSSLTCGNDDLNIVRHQLHLLGEGENEDITKAYNEAFACWNGSKYAFAFMAGRVALSACIYGLNLQPGDEVLMPGYTCVVVPNAFGFAGVTPVYCDIELNTFGLDAAGLEKEITPRTKAILVHHLYGLVCRDYEEILGFARRHELSVIEDCAQSTGAMFKGKRVGNWGDVAFYSSEQSKSFSTGQGGLATTNNDDIAARMADYYRQAPLPDKNFIKKLMATFIFSYYYYAHPHKWFLSDWARYKYGADVLISTDTAEINGQKPAHYGCKMPSSLAVLGLNQLKKLEGFNDLRRTNAQRWTAWCEENGYIKAFVLPESEPVFIRYPVLVEAEKKADTRWAQRELGINPGVWFSAPLHPSGFEVTGCPNAIEAVKRCINFPTL